MTAAGAGRKMLVHRHIRDTRVNIDSRGEAELIVGADFVRMIDLSVIFKIVCDIYVHLYYRKTSGILYYTTR